jgi:hypothetical protein
MLHEDDGFLSGLGGDEIVLVSGAGFVFVHREDRHDGGEESGSGLNIGARNRRKQPDGIGRIDMNRNRRSR